MWIVYKIEENVNMVDAVEVLPLLRENYLRMLHNYVWNGGLIVCFGSADQKSDHLCIFLSTMSSSPDFWFRFICFFLIDKLTSKQIGAALVLRCPLLNKTFVILSSSIFPLALQSSFILLANNEKLIKKNHFTRTSAINILSYKYFEHSLCIETNLPAVKNVFLGVNQ